MLRLAYWPNWSRGNPYQRLLYQELNAAGIEVAGSFVFCGQWLRANRSKVDVLHFHWPEQLWNDGNGLANELVQLLRLWKNLRLAKRLGYKMIWTVHNLDSHEGATQSDRFGQSLLAKYADFLVCHDEEARRRINKRWPGAKCVVMPHGNYDGVYPKPRPRDEVLSELGLDPAKPTFCCVGLLREYKGFELAVEAVRYLDDGVQLIVAGSEHESHPLDRIRVAAAADERIILIDRRISDQEFADIVSASDGMMLPYKKITGSGALLAAWTLGTGVIASDLPYFREMATPESHAAEFFEPGNSKSLASAITQFCDVEREVRRQRVLDLSAKYRWEKCIEPLLKELAAWEGTSVTMSATIAGAIE